MKEPKFTLDSALPRAYSVFKANGWQFLGLLSLGGLLIVLPGLAGLGLAFAMIPEGPMTVMKGILAISSFVILPLMELGWINIQLKFVADEKPNSDDLWSPIGKFWAFVGCQWILGFVCLIGTVVALTPPTILFGIYSSNQSPPFLVSAIISLVVDVLVLLGGIVYLYLVFMFYPFFLVDKRTGPLKALSASFAITKGARWELLFFLLVLKFIEGICGILLIVGSVAAIMFSRLATTCVYKMLLESTPADLLPAFAGVLIEPQPEPDQDWEKDGPVDADLV